MTAEGLFSILNLVTMAAWLPLLLLPRARWASHVVPAVVPGQWISSGVWPSGSNWGTPGLPQMSRPKRSSPR